MPLGRWSSATVLFMPHVSLPMHFYLLVALCHGPHRGRGGESLYSVMCFLCSWFAASGTSVQSGKPRATPCSNLRRKNYWSLHRLAR